MSAVSGAVETAPVSSLHALGSADPADFAVPAGREEEWRFTPLRRLRGLHSDTELGSAGVTVEVDSAPELDSERSRLTADSMFLPADRVSARAFAAAPPPAGDGRHGAEGRGRVAAHLYPGDRHRRAGRDRRAPDHRRAAVRPGRRGH